MKLSQKSLILLPCLLWLALGSGCATSALWKNDQLEAWKEPADNPNLHLYDGGDQKDLLVVYDRYSDRCDSTRPVAYWLYENEKRINQHRAPEFVSTKLAQGLAPVPVFDSLPDQSNPLPRVYALIATNGQSFTLFSDTSKAVTHELPVYNDGKGKLEKAALTPLTVTADITIIGGFVGYACLAGYVGSQYNPSY